VPLHRLREPHGPPREVPRISQEVDDGVGRGVNGDGLRIDSHGIRPLSVGPRRLSLFGRIPGTPVTRCLAPFAAPGEREDAEAHPRGGGPLANELKILVPGQFGGASRRPTECATLPCYLAGGGPDGYRGTRGVRGARRHGIDATGLPTEAN